MHASMAPRLLMLAVAACVLMQPAVAFLPNPIYSYVVHELHRNLTGDPEGPGTARTHLQITAEALLRVTINFLLDISTDPTVQMNLQELKQKENYIVTTQELLEAYYGRDHTRNRQVLFERMIKEVYRGNENTDLGFEEVDVSAAHFDAEQFADGQKRLHNLRKEMVMALKGCDVRNARFLLGRMYHGVQDFYSHTNWVEMGNREPHPELAKRDREISDTAEADPNEDTCDNCPRNDSRIDDIERFFNNLKNGTLLKELGVDARIAPSGHSQYLYQCPLTNVYNASLTSGYFPGATKTDRKTPIPKPERPGDATAGKCSHGGYPDPSSDEVAWGGINKDTPSEFFGYHEDLHIKATNIALEHSIQLLEDIKTSEEITDEEFASFLNLAITEIEIIKSLVVVVDTSNSAAITGIKNAINMATQEVESYVETEFGRNARMSYGLVTVGSDGKAETYSSTNSTDFRDKVGNLEARDDTICTRPILEGIIKAAQISQENSNIYVFTDATQSDTAKWSHVQALVAEKSLRVSFILTESCGMGDFSSTYISSLYYLLTSHSSGEYLVVTTEEISATHSLLYLSSEEVYGAVEFGGSRNDPETLTEVDFQFSVDKTMDGDTVIITIMSSNITNATVVPPQECANSAATKIEATTNVYLALETISGPGCYGDWSVITTVKAPYTYWVTATSDLTFSCDLLELTQDKSARYGFVYPDGHLYFESDFVVFVETHGDFGGVTFNESRALNADDGSIEETVVLESPDDPKVYMAFLQHSQDTLNLDTFYVQLKGVDTMNNTVSRIGSPGFQTTDIHVMLARGESQYEFLEAGERLELDLTLENRGDTDTFQLACIGDSYGSPFTCTVDSTRLMVEKDDTKPFKVTITAPEEVGEGICSNLVVIAATDRFQDQRTDYTTIVAFAEIPEPSSGTRLQLSILLLLLLSAMALI